MEQDTETDIQVIEAEVCLTRWHLAVIETTFIEFAMKVTPTASAHESHMELTRLGSETSRGQPLQGSQGQGLPKPSIFPGA